MLVERNLPFLLMDHLPGILSRAFPVKHAIALAVHKTMISMVLPCLPLAC